MGEVIQELNLSHFREALATVDSAAMIAEKSDFNFERASSTLYREVWRVF